MDISVVDFILGYCLAIATVLFNYFTPHKIPSNQNSFNVSRELNFIKTDWSDAYIRVISSYSSDPAQKNCLE